jgi:hypothetical protein
MIRALHVGLANGGWPLSGWVLSRAHWLDSGAEEGLTGPFVVLAVASRCWFQTILLAHLTTPKASLGDITARSARYWWIFTLHAGFEDFISQQ